MRITKEVRDILADAVKGFKSGLKPVFNEWGDEIETACLLTSAKLVRNLDVILAPIILHKGWDDSWVSDYYGWHDPIYQAAYKLGCFYKRKWKING